jgi:hypothetical protein
MEIVVDYMQYATSSRGKCHNCADYNHKDRLLYICIHEDIRGLCSAYSCFTRYVQQARYANNGDQLAFASGLPMSDNELQTACFVSCHCCPRVINTTLRAGRLIVCDQQDKSMSIKREPIVTTCATPYVEYVLAQGARLKSSSPQRRVPYGTKKLYSGAGTYDGASPDMSAACFRV